MLHLQDEKAIYNDDPREAIDGRVQINLLFRFCEPFLQKKANFYRIFSLYPHKPARFHETQFKMIKQKHINAPKI